MHKWHDFRVFHALCMSLDFFSFFSGSKFPFFQAPLVFIDRSGCCTAGSQHPPSSVRVVVYWRFLTTRS